MKLFFTTIFFLFLIFDANFIAELFHKVIIQSGNIFDPLTTVVEPESILKKMNKLLRITETNPTKIKEKLKKIDSKILIEVQTILPARSTWM